MGDREMYARVYTHYLPKLYHFILVFSKGSKEDAEEIVQEVFLKIWMYREALVGVRSFEAYMFSIARNLLYDIHRRRKQLKAIIATLAADRSEAAESIQNTIIFKEYHKTAIDAINQLSGQKKKIFHLRTQQGLKLGEIASELNLSVPGVKKHLYETIHFIKNYLRDHGDFSILIAWLLMH